QFISGSLGDLFDHLRCQDFVSFTGSAATALRLKSHPAVLRNAVRFVAETDSLNSSILAPDVRPDMAEFDLFIKEVAREMTVKAGQKCTAIRKALVPRDLLGQVVQALQAALGKVVIGDPRAQGVRMGPLAGIEQKRELLARVAELREEAELVF